MEDMTGATAVQLMPTSSDDLIAQLNAAARVRVRWPLLLLLPVIGWLLAPWVRLREKARRSVVVFYEVEDVPDQWFGRLVETWTGMASAAAVWRVRAEGALTTTYQRKVNAGASSVESRVKVPVTLTGPQTLVTNIPVPSVSDGEQAIYFLPDRALVRNGSKFSDVDYDSLNAAFATTRFIESGPVPGDSQQVGSTWEHVNVKGGPDRRFKTNRQLPILQYGALEFSTPTGLHWTLECSNPQRAKDVVTTVEAALSLPALSEQTNDAD